MCDHLYGLVCTLRCSDSHCLCFSMRLCKCCVTFDELWSSICSRFYTQFKKKKKVGKKKKVKTHQLVVRRDPLRIPGVCGAQLRRHRGGGRRFVCPRCEEIHVNTKIKQLSMRARGARGGHIVKDYVRGGEKCSFSSSHRLKSSG